MNDDDNIIDFGEEAKKRAGKLKTILGGLGKLSPVEFGQRRPELIAELGVSRSDLDKEYRERRKATKKADNGGGKEFGNAIEPWDTEVDGQRLLSDLVAAIKSHLVLPVGAAETVALWIIFTHAFDAFDIAPVLAITSPTPECGKTTGLTLLSAVVPKPLQSSNVTASVVFRAVEKWQPTLLIDEADTFLRDSDELRGVLNSGHNRRSAFILRTVGDDHEPKQFSTWSPKAIALIGKMHPTLASRSIHVELQRKMPTETVEPLRPDRLAHLEPLARKAARWSADNLSALPVDIGRWHMCRSLLREKTGKATTGSGDLTDDMSFAAVQGERLSSWFSPAAAIYGPPWTGAAEAKCLRVYARLRHEAERAT